MSIVGTDRPRIDADDKLRGATRYLGDLKPHGLLHGRLVLAMDAHATINRVIKDAALAIPGVVAVLTAEDLPTAMEGPMRQFEPLARGEIVFQGQPVALVLAETEAAAEDGVEAVIVETTSHAAVLDLEAADDDELCGVGLKKPEVKRLRRYLVTVLHGGAEPI